MIYKNSLIKKFRNRGKNFYRSFKFFQFQRRFHPGIISCHDEVLNWAIGESNDLNSDMSVVMGKELFLKRQAVLTAFKDKYKERQMLRILIHVPSPEVSMGGYSVFSNLAQALSYLGIPAMLLGWDDKIEPYLNEFAPNVFLTSDASNYKDRVNWDAFNLYRKKTPIKFGLTASLVEQGENTLQSRLKWAKENGVDFYYSWQSQEFIKSEESYKPYFDNDYPIYSIEFGANLLLYYPIQNIQRDLDYIFLASSNGEKQLRYFSYLTDIVQNHSGFINGPGWFFVNKLAVPSTHKYLYARGKVGINIHVNHSIDLPTELNERTYILAASGIPQLIDNPKLLHSRFSEDSMFIAETPREYNDLFRFILDNPEEANKRAMKAFKEVYSQHTTFHRAENFIKELEN